MQKIYHIFLNEIATSGEYLAHAEWDFQNASTFREMEHSQTTAFLVSYSRAQNWFVGPLSSFVFPQWAVRGGGDFLLRLNHHVFEGSLYSIATDQIEYYDDKVETCYSYQNILNVSNFDVNIDRILPTTTPTPTTAPPTFDAVTTTAVFWSSEEERKVPAMVPAIG